MPNVERHAPGEFCWIELATSNQNAAKSFYTALFGWTVQDFPMGPGQVYSMFQLQGRDAGGAFAIGAEESAAGVPPHWQLYVAVASADESAKKVVALGGMLKEGPFDVMDKGKMALIQDPTGAYISLWEAKTHSGLGIAGVPGAFCWADLSTPSQDTAKAFYEGLFGWTLKAGEGKESVYLHIKNGENYIGGVPPARQSDGKEPPHWLLYFAVDDVDKSFRKAQDLKARILLHPMDFENVGRVAILSDPQGAVFALFREAR
jgi:predicted enzyme related to lactoylglutathione lyase